MSSRRILLGITGGIAAYKCAFLIRLLIKSGYEIQPVLSESAKSFVTPLTLATLSGKPVLQNFFDKETGEWNNHIRLASEAGLILFAPLTAETLAKMAGGHSDNLLTAIYLSARGPVMAAPAMDLDMYRHPAVKRNLERIENDGCKIIPAEHGELASGLEGEGRMAEPENILQYVNDFFSGKSGDKPLSGKTFLVSAGPTYEPIDPVRFIGNNSSGKMGIALAHELARRGAEVKLVCGPVHSVPDHQGISVEKVKTAEEMYHAIERLFPESDGLFMAAAVADFTPENAADQKIKKGENEVPAIALKKTTDILATIGKKNKDGRFICGFSLETQNARENAQKKLKAKNMDMIVMNTLEDEGAGFEGSTNKITIFDKHGGETGFPLKEKVQVAVDIVNYAEKFLKIKQ